VGTTFRNSQHFAGQQPASFKTLEKSMATYVQTNRPMTVTTPLGKDKFLLTGFTGHEVISHLFNFQLDLVAENETQVPFDQLLGQKITVQLRLSDGGNRYFNGICNRISQGARDGGYTAYRLDVVPQFWLLSRRAQSRIFQHISVPDILKKVLDGLDVAYEIQGTFQPRDYCVQYRETDFNFASRLMEEEGIYYFFKHSDGAHKMVLANSPGSHPAVPGASSVMYETIEGVHRPEDRVHSWEKFQELRSGKCTLWDHCFELPHKHLEADKPILESVAVGQVTHKLKVGGNDKLEIYDFPGEYAQRFDGVDKGGGDQPAELQKIFDDNKRTVGIRMQEEALPSLLIQGTSTCGQFTSGHKFTLTKHFDANGSYVLTGVHHAAKVSNYLSGNSEFSYHNSFTCIPYALPYAPPRTTPKPFVQGTQTAVVVGPAGEEIFTDKYGRVKVQFHWDRQGKNDADSSCWVRVAQIWAGKRWGAFFWPRIGQEVVTAFEEGDPDRPIIVGSVYNADQMPPYLGDGPDSKHKKDNKVSGIKTNTTPGGKGYNELRFDDTKDKQEIFIHAERDMDTRVKNDSRERVMHDRHLIVGYKSGDEDDGQYKVEGDQRELVYQDKHLNVKRHQIEKIEGNQQLTVGKGEAQDGGNVDIIIEKDKKELIEQNSHLHVKQNRKEKIDQAQSITVGSDQKETIGGKYHLHVKSDRNEKVDGTQSLTVGMNQYEKVGQDHALDAGMAVHIKAGMTVVIEAGMQLSLKVGGNFIDIGPAGIAIQGTMVMINSGGAAGSGSGSSPTSPEDADAPDDAKEAKPTKPDMADMSKTGQKSAPS
jgi:type VI secretion system secreted protein VgrG